MTTTKSLLEDAKLLLKFNPYHDELGRFAHGPGGRRSIPDKPSEAYRAEIRKWAANELQTYPRPGKYLPDEALYILGAPRRASAETDAMAEYMEKNSSRSAMVKAMSSQTSWGPSGGSKSEWRGAEALGATIPEKWLKEDARGWKEHPKLTEVEGKAFQARSEFIQHRVKKLYPDSIKGDKIVLYRGIHGTQAKKLVESGARQGSAINLGVYPLSSFSVKRYSAMRFADGTSVTSSRGRKQRYQVVLKCEVPISDIFGANDVGGRSVIRYSDDHGEVVVLNRKTTREATIDYINS